MQVEIRGQGVELTEGARERLNSRLDFALGRLGDGVSRVWVQLADQGKRCRVLVRMQQLPDVLVEEREGNLDMLLARTVHKAGLAARRELARRSGRH